MNEVWREIINFPTSLKVALRALENAAGLGFAIAGPAPGWPFSWEFHNLALTSTETNKSLVWHHI